MIASVVIVPIALVFEGLPPKLTATNAVGFAYLSLVATGGGFALWFNGIRRLPTQAPPILGLAAPITGAALGWIILNEDLTIAQIVGFAITAAAITYAATIGARPTTTRNHCVQRLPTPDTALRRDATPCQPAPQATCGPAPTCR